MSDPGGWRRHWPLLRRLLIGAFLATVGWLLVRQAMAVDWPAVWSAMRAQPGTRLALAGLLAATGYSVYCSYELLAKRYAKHGLPARRVLPVAFVSYAFNLNMGAMIGGAGFRFRLYSQRGLDAADISRVLAFSVVANWSGYVVLLGAILLMGAVPVPAGWELGRTGLRWVGAALLLAAAGYLLLTLLWRQRSIRLRGNTFTLPPPTLAAGAMGLSMLHWSLIGTLVWLLLGQEIGWATVLGVLLLAAVAGALTHVPAGLGVVEAVFLAVLPDAMPRAEMLGALLTYRAVYYLAPLLVAALVYAILEFRSSTRNRHAPPHPHPPVGAA